MQTLTTAAQDFLPLLRRGKWFNSLPLPLQTSLLALAHVCEYSPGECLFSRGHPDNGIFAVLEGMIKIAGVSASGKEAILTMIDPPNWFGEIALFDREARTHDAYADGSIVVLHIPHKELDALLEAHPHYWREFGRLLTQKLRLTFRAIEDLALLPAPMRLSRRLVMMAEGYGELKGQSRRIINVSQEQLGLILSISRQTANQILKDLEAKGIIRVTYGEIEICDLDALRQLGR
ncbi:MAG: Crp/Fnr family transcriptional regulator [Hahellaceae bacterium]|nr:Crp/Fnr family transcriptional regulator [Hahellaceae bacterium]MCP5169976.1 Crp/Fnr family transcriptional regulator [Hahellaceae bacterium]